MNKKVARFVGILGVAALAWTVFWALPRTGPSRSTTRAANDELILPWLKGYLATCEASNSRFDQQLGSGFAKEFCMCMAQNYVTLMSEAELLDAATTGGLPAHIKKQRVSLQNTCFDQTAAKIQR